MKKLMCAIAAVSAGICLADVSSANVVGYQNKEVKGGQYNMNVGTFLACGKAKADMTFGDITANRDFAFGSDTIMTLTTLGRTGDIITYLTAEEASEYGIEGLKAGWYSQYYVNNEWDWENPIPDEQCWNNKKLPYGTMVIVQGNEGANINYAGEVLSENHQFEIVGGQYNMIGNATPVDLVMGDITANRDFAFGSDTIMTLTTIGRTGDIITYLTAEEASEYGIEGLKPGWYSQYYVNNEWDWENPIPNDQCFNTMPVPSGYGFIAQGNDGAIVEIPTPLAD